ncbi:histidine kinase OS=Lysinibacillus sphaericus OX=1421 GN=citA_2 PE=4 SV=1 [Lysinibacillus sphaericus]
MRSLFQSLTVKMIFLMSILILMICGLFMYLLQEHIRDTTEKQIGVEALNIAKTIASMEEIITAFEHENPSDIIQPIVEPLREEINAAFIVVGNAQGVRYSHPAKDRIGHPMVGGDNDAALLNKQAYISKTVGSLGESIRGKAPIMIDENIIGVVSVGFLTAHIDGTIGRPERKYIYYGTYEQNE